MVSEKTDSKEKNENDRSDEAARRRREAERLEELAREAREKEAIRKEKEAAEARLRENQTKVEPVSVDNTDGTALKKNEKGQVFETKDIKGEIHTYGYNEKGELNSFSEKGKVWTTTDGEHWQSPNQKPRALQAFVNPEDGNFGVTEATVTTTRLTQSKLTDGRLTEATDLNGQKRTFTYNESGAVSGFTDEKGKQWSSKDGKVWKAEAEPPRLMSISVNTGDGSLVVTEAASKRLEFLNGKSITQDRNGTVARDKDDHVIETKAQNDGASNNFIYTDGKLTSLSIAGGQPYSTTDGINFISPTGEKIRNAKVDGDGLLTYVNDKGDVLKVGANGQPAVVITRDALEKSADSIAYAMNGGIGAGTDRVTIKNELNLLNQTAREELDRLWTEKHKQGASNYEFATLDEEFVDETEGSELAELRAVYNRQDGKANVVGRVDTALTELSEYNPDHSDSTNEKNIRELVGTLNSEQIAQYDKEFSQKNNGQTLQDKVLNDANVSDATKEALPILLKGQDKRTDADTQALVEIALKHKNMDLLQESLRNSTPAARQALQESGVNSRILTAWADYNDSGEKTNGNSQTMIAMDYAKHGKLTVASEIRLNTSDAGDNDKAIDTALTQMSAEEKQAYIRGRELSVSTTDEAKLSQTDKNALDSYRDVQAAMKGAGYQWELNRWEGFIVNSKEQGDFLAKVYSHRGSIYNSSRQDMSQAIEDMPEDVWKRLKAEQTEGKTEFRDQITKAFESYKDPESVKQLQTIIDEKLKAEKFEDAEANGRRDVDTGLKDALGDWDNDERAGLKVLQKMTEAEQERYRSDDEFRKKIDTRVQELFTNPLQDGSELAAANLILDRIKNRQKTDDVLVDLAVYSQDGYVNEAEVVRRVQEAYRKDPGLHDRIINPKTDEEKAYAEQFKKLIPAALGNNVFDDDGTVYGKDLIEKGEISIEKRMLLNRGDFDDDEMGAYKDIVYANAAETKRLLNEPDYADKVMFFLSKEEREVAINNLKERERLNQNHAKLEQQLVQLKEDKTLGAEEKEQATKLLEDKVKKSEEHIDKFFAGKMRTEDAFRAAVLGAGTDEEAIKKAVNDAGEMDTARNDYAKKYGVSLVSDASDELGGQDLSSVLRVMRPSNTSQEEDFVYALDEFSNSRGFGAEFVRTSWDGTADQTDKSFNEFASKVSQANRAFDQLSPEERQEAISRLEERIDNLIESKEALGNMVADVVLTVAAVGGTILGNPETMGLLAFTTFAGTLGLTGAVLKVAIKQAVMGNNYTSDMMYADLASGFVDAGLNVLGPAQVGKLFSVGKVAAKDTALSLTEKLVQRNLLKTVTSEGVETLAETTVTKIPSRVLKETDNLVMDAITSGAKEFDDKAINAAAKRMVDSEIGEVAFKKAMKENLGKKAANELREKAMNEAAEPIAQILKESLQEQVKLSTEPLVRYSTAAMFEAGGGAAGGGGSGFVYSLSSFDSSKSLAENIQMIGKATLLSTVIGGVAGGVASTVFKGAGDAFHNLKAAKTVVDETDTVAEQSTARTIKSTVNETDGVTEASVTSSKTRQDLNETISSTDTTSTPARITTQSSSTETVPGRITESNSTETIPGRMTQSNSTQSDNVVPSNTASQNSNNPVSSSNRSSVWSPGDQPTNPSIANKLDDTNPYSKYVSIVPGEKTGNVWNQSFVPENHAAAEYAAATLKLKDYSLMKPEVRSAFNDDFDLLTRKWSSQEAPVRAQYNKAVAEVDDALEKYRAMVNRAMEDTNPLVRQSDKTHEILSVPSTLKEISQSSDAAIYGLNKLSAEDMRIVDDLASKQKALIEAAAKVSPAALGPTRLQDLQVLLDDLSERSGLPKNRLQLAADGGNDAGSYIDGVITIRESSLTRMGNEQLGNLVFHETVHSQQQFMAARKLADELNLGGSSSKEIAALQSEWMKQMGDAMPENYARDILTMRNGIPLNDSERQAAEELIKSWNARHQIPEKLSQSAQTIHAVDDIVEKLKSENGKREFDSLLAPGAPQSDAFYALRQKIEETFDEDAKKSWLDRLQKLEQEGVTNLYARKSNDQVRERMIDLLQESTEHINSWRQLEFSRYAGLRHEWDAYWAGAVVEKEMRERSLSQTSQVRFDPTVTVPKVRTDLPNRLQSPSFQRSSTDILSVKSDAPGSTTTHSSAKISDSKVIKIKPEVRSEAENAGGNAASVLSNSSSTGTTGGSTGKPFLGSENTNVESASLQSDMQSSTGTTQTAASVSPTSSAPQTNSLSSNVPSQDPPNTAALASNGPRDLAKDGLPNQALIDALPEDSAPAVSLLAGASPGHATLELKEVTNEILIPNQHDPFRIGDPPYDRNSGKLVVTQSKTLRNTPDFAKQHIAPHNSVGKFTADGELIPGELYKVWREKKQVYEEWLCASPKLLSRTETKLIDASQFAEIARLNDIPLQLGHLHIGDPVTIPGGEGIVVGFDGGDVVVRSSALAKPKNAASNFKVVIGEVEEQGFRLVDSSGPRLYRDGEGRLFTIDTMDGTDTHVLTESFDFVAINHASDNPAKLLPRELDPAPVVPAKVVSADVVPPVSPLKALGYDPALNQPVLKQYENAGLTFNGQRFSIDRQKGLSIGRDAENDIVISGLQTSRKHADVKWDGQKQLFYLEDHSANGCQLRRTGEVDRLLEPGKGERVYLRQGDEILVGDNLIRLDLPNYDQATAPLASKYVDTQIYLAGQNVAATDVIYLGANSPQLGNSRDVVDRLVSREHAQLTRDPLTGKWRLTDTTKAPNSSYDFSDRGTIAFNANQPNGTYLFRDGKWTVLRGSDGPPNNSIELIEGDIIRLGSQSGPELKLTSNNSYTSSLDGGLTFTRKNGDVLINRVDGLQEIETQFGVKTLSDSDGKILRTTDKNKNGTTFTYDKNNAVNKISFADGSVAELKDGQWFRTENGVEKPWWKGEITVESDGGIRYTAGKSITIDRLDGTREIVDANGRTQYTNVTYLDELQYVRKIARNDNFFKTPLEQERFVQMIADFETTLKRDFHARGLDHVAAEKELALTLHHLRRMLDAGEESLVSQSRRIELAEQIMYQVNHPQLISQGSNPTCNVTTVEQRIFTQNPSEAARLISDVSTTGHYITSDGTVIDVSRIQGSLDPDLAARELLNRTPPNDLRLDGKRTYASQIFEQTAVNIKYQRNKSNFSFLEYRKIETLPGQEEHQLVKYSLDGNNVLQTNIEGTGPTLGVEDLGVVHNAITGKNDSGFVIAGPYSLKDGSLKPLEKTNAVTRPPDFNSFVSLLRNTKRSDYPLIISVSVGHPKFFQNVGVIHPGDPGGHVMSIRSISEFPPGSGRYQAELINQWHAADNEVVSLEDVWEIMMPAPQNRKNFKK
ncbi:hypothetical protein BH10CYA1_BH10CYA1_32610 [soil metagenome]